jgi:Heterokaryon incompatibility protein (HET)
MTGPHQDELSLHCKLFHVSLNENPQYIALSYTWGDPRDTQTIIIGNAPVPVTRNLYSAMYHLVYYTNTKVVWIDALCINQTDDEEKSWQVQLMKEIYQRADHVSVWLGPADATSDTVMDFLHSFGTKAMACGIDLARN